MEMVRAANVLAGTDENCTNWIMTYRDYQAGSARQCRPCRGSPAAASSGGRRGGRDARRAAMAGGGAPGIFVVSGTGGGSEPSAS
jgi:5-methyltetrahydrofolate--homocysteine methyltransferase